MQGFCVLAIRPCGAATADSLPGGNLDCFVVKAPFRAMVTWGNLFYKHGVSSEH